MKMQTKAQESNNYNHNYKYNPEVTQIPTIHNKK